MNRREPSDQNVGRTKEGRAGSTGRSCRVEICMLPDLWKMLHIAGKKVFPIRESNGICRVSCTGEVVEQGEVACAWNVGKARTGKGGYVGCHGLSYVW